MFMGMDCFSKKSTRGQFPAPMWNCTQQSITLALEYLMPLASKGICIHMYTCSHTHTIKIIKLILEIKALLTKHQRKKQVTQENSKSSWWERRQPHPPPQATRTPLFCRCSFSTWQSFLPIMIQSSRQKRRCGSRLEDTLPLRLL